MQTRACRFSPFQEVKLQEMVNAMHIALYDQVLISLHRRTKCQLDIFLGQ